MDLHDYPIRKCKATDNVRFFLESAKNNLRKTVTIGFDSRELFYRCYNVVHSLVLRRQLENL